MRRIFDFRFAGKKTMPVKLPPDGRELNLIVPSKAALEDFYAKYENFEARCEAARTAEELNAIIDEIYGMAAKLLSCNVEEQTFTGKDLRVMGFEEEALFPFFASWVDFVREVETSKN